MGETLSNTDLIMSYKASMIHLYIVLSVDRRFNDITIFNRLFYDINILLRGVFEEEFIVIAFSNKLEFDWKSLPS